MATETIYPGLPGIVSVYTHHYYLINSNTLATWCEELTHLKRLWCWERLRAGEEGNDRGWDGWMASPTQWTWVWVDSGSWWRTGRPGVLQFMASQRVGHNWATELNWLTAGIKGNHRQWLTTTQIHYLIILEVRGTKQVSLKLKQNVYKAGFFWRL